MQQTSQAEDEESSVAPSSASTDATASSAPSLKDQLLQKLKSIKSRSPPQVDNPRLKDQFVRYLSGGNPLTPDLISLRMLLESIPPSSVEAERAFSAAGLFATKLRGRLSDESLNMLAVLRAHLLDKYQSECSNE